MNGPSFSPLFSPVIPHICTRLKAPSYVLKWHLTLCTHVSVVLKSAHALIYTPLWATNSALPTPSQPSITLPRIQLAFIVPVVSSILVHSILNLSQHCLLIVSGPPNLPNYGAWWPSTLHHHILPIDTPYPDRLLSSSDCHTKRHLFHSFLKLPVPINSFYEPNLHLTISYHHLMLQTVYAFPPKPMTNTSHSPFLPGMSTFFLHHWSSWRWALVATPSYPT